MQRIGFIVFPGFNVMTCAVIAAFELANREMGEPVYDVRLLSETGGSIRASIGMSVATHPFGRANFDTPIMGGGTEPPTNRQIAELAAQIARQRATVKQALDTGQGSEMAESLLDALEGSLRIFEKHRIFLLSCNGSSRALPPSGAATGRSLSRPNGHG